MAWTVITHLNYGGYDHIGAVSGRVGAYGHNIHAAHVSARSADDAINQVREAFHLIGPDRVTADDAVPPKADRWTVVGLADNGTCATHTVLAVIEGGHEVHGRRDSMLSHRWTRIVDAPTAEAAERAGEEAAAADYADTWN
ncbi:hypothetical protein ABT336_12185 [Micromonospora sp. NPDC000207]|uniref:hypothetical protein n=1 Tax=Micromonospora sp. NPDC000207 TaxID=3154246 RepID=UPI00332EEE9D